MLCNINRLWGPERAKDPRTLFWESEVLGSRGRLPHHVECGRNLKFEIF